MLRRLVLLLVTVFALCGQSLWADDQLLEIGIFRSKSLYSVTFKPSDDSYRIYDQSDSMIYHLDKYESVTIKVNADKSITVKVPEKTIGSFKEFSIQSFSSDSHYAIKGSNPSTKERKYFGGIKCFSLAGKLDVVSLVTMQHYLEGVLESEAGNHQGKEYYKVQAIISRTYAMKNKGKFLHEGFMMTDLTNCQVYLGKMYRNPKIEEAVKETKSLVLVDENMRLISAAFFSNSGGQTSHSEHVWSKKVSYLRSVHDPFSKGKYNYHWTKSFDKDDFLKDVKKFYDFPTEDTAAVNELLNWKQENRAKYFVDWKYHILLTDVRSDFGLKSTFFSVIDEGDKVTLKGKGFGHGVGLSQEGAMNMCDMGYSFRDVLHFYYTGVHLIDYRMLNFYLSD
jgi:stage II sporulation protein D